MAIENIGLVAVTENAAKKVAVKGGGKIKAAAGTKYLLQVIGSDVSPENVTVQRDGKDLKVFFEGSEKPDLTIQDFFADGTDSQLYGVAEDGQLYAYVRTDGEGFYGQLLMNDGESAPIALGGESLGDGAAYLASSFDEAAGFVLWPWLLGLAGVGAVAAAASHHGGGGHHETPTSAGPTNIKVIDDVGPIQGQLANGDVTDDANPTITGGGVPGAVIHIIDNGTEIGSTTVDKDGTWSFTPTTGLPDGEHDVTAIQVEPGKKPSPPVDVLDFTVDTVPPADPVATIEGGVENGGDLYSPSNTPTVTGTGDPGDTITVVFPTGEKASTTVDLSGNWSVTPKDPIPEGPVDIIVTEQDPAGNTGTTVLPAIIDTIAPDVPQAWLDPASDSGIKGDGITNDNTPKIDGKTEPGATVTVTIQPTGEVIKTIADDNGDWSVTPKQPIPDGPVDIEVTATDKAGNTSQPKDLPLTIDTTPPDAPKVWLTINVVAGDDIVNKAESQQTQTISGKVGGEFVTGDVVSFTLNGTAYSAAVSATGNWSVSVAGSDLAKGSSIDATLIAHDAAGNEATVTATRPYSVDVIDPVATLTINVVAGDDIVNASEAMTNQTISGKAGGEFLAGDLVTFTLNGTAYSAAVNATGEWSVQVSGTDLAKEANIHATLEAHDAAGNVASVIADRAYSVDTTPPVATLTIDVIAGDDIVNKEESQQPQTISGKVTGEFMPDDVVSFVLNGTAYSAKVNATGDWSVSVAGSDLAKETNIHAVLMAHDAAGNLGSIVADRAYTVVTDSGNTTLTIDTVAGDDVVNLVESKESQTISGKVGGTYLEGDKVTFTLNGHDYSASVAADGSWSVAVPGSDLVDDTAHQIVATVIGHDAAGNANTVTVVHGYSVDIDPPKPDTTQLTINDVTSDNILNAAEAKSPQTISGKAIGEFMPDDVVSFTLNGTTYSAKVAASGDWSVSVAGSDLAKETNIHATLMAHDAAGNVAPITADHAYQVIINPLAVTLSIDTIAGDDVVNLAESKESQTISGKAVGAGGFTVGDLVSFTLNGHVYSASVSADGTWKVDVAGSDLAAETNIHATLVAHDDAGNLNSVSADRAYTVDTVPPVATLSIDDVTSDNILNTDESTKPQTISGKASGEFMANDVVSFTLNGTTYSAAVAADGKWSVVVAGADLAQETNIHATLVAHDAAGNSANVVADHPYTVNVTPPVASLYINIVAGDDIVNLEESKVDQAVTGGSTGGRAGDVVTLVVNGVSYSGTLDAQGKWSINVPGSELVADPAHRIDATLVATNVAGNSASVTASHLYSVDVTPPAATLTINVVAGDDVVNSTEAASPQTISGRAGGEFVKGDLVSFTLNGTTYSAAVDSTGNWSVTVSGADLAKETNIHATLEAHDTAGNVASVVADRAYTVDTTPPVANLTINVVAGDDVLNYAESQTPQTISGKVTGEFMVGDTVSFTLNGTDYKATVNATGDWSVQVAGGDLAKANSINATLVAHDAAGNEATVTATHPYTVEITPPVAGLIINVVAGDDVVNIAESQQAQAISGKATGQFLAGDIVSFTLNGTVYSAAVDAAGEWNVQVAGSDLAKGSSINATLVAHDSAGNATDVLGTRPYSVDLAPPVATLTINVVAGDDIVNKAESQQPQTISGKVGGEFVTGDVVSFTLNGTAYSAAVSATGNWSVSVAGSDLAKGSSIDATLIAHDAAGNEATVTATRPYSVDVIDPVATLTINVVAGDDIVNASEAMTNQTISGKAGGEFLAGDLVTFTLNGTAYSAAVNASGDWSVQVSGTDLAKGTSIDATLVAHDAAGNSSNVTANHPYTVDLSPPDDSTTKLTINVIAGDDILNLAESQQAQTISGKATGEFMPNDVVSFILNGTTYSAKVNADGDWSVSVAGADLAKETNIHAVLMAHDVAGNIGAIIADRAYTVDIIPPAAPVIVSVFDAVGDVTGNLKPGDTTDDTRPKISGTAEANSTVEIYDNGTAIGSAKTDASGNWTFTPTSDLANGGHALTAKATDVAGNVSPLSNEFGFNVYTGSTTTPEITHVIDSVGSITGDIAKDGVTDDKRPEIQGTAEAGSKVTVYDGATKLGETTADASGNWSFKPTTDLVDGQHTITATSTNSAGNVSPASNAWPFTVDTVAPAKPVITDVQDDVGPITGTVANGGVTDDSQPTLHGTAEAGSKVTVYDNGTPLGETQADPSGHWTFTPAAPISEGKHDFTVDATDAAGNTSPKSDIYSITTDYTGPKPSDTQLTIDSITADNVINSAEAAGNIKVSGKVTGEFTAGDVVSFKLAGTSYSAQVAADGTWSVDVPGSKLVDETTHSIDATLVAHDAAGNAGNITASHAYDVMLNGVTITCMSKDTAIDLAHSTDFITADGSAGRGVYGTLQQALTGTQKVQVSYNGTTWTDAVTSGLNWVTVDTSMHTGDWTIQARIVDNGQVQSDIATQTVTYLADKGNGPTIIGIPDGVGSYTQAKAADGSDVQVSLAGTLAKAGDTLHIIWGDTTYDQVLTAADIAAGTVTAKVPAQQTLLQGTTFSFAVTAQIVTAEGQMSGPSDIFQMRGEGWSTLAQDGMLRAISADGTYKAGGFTVTSNNTLSIGAASTYANAGLNLAGPSTSYAQVNFTTPVSSFSVNISGLQNTAGGSRVVVYDTAGNILSDTMALADGTGGKAASTLYSFTAPTSADIGKVMIYSDGVDLGGAGIRLDSIKFNQIHYAPGYTETFTNLVGKSGSFYCPEGHFTITSKGTVTVNNTSTVPMPSGPYLYIGANSASSMGTQWAAFTFDQPVKYFSYDMWGVENAPGNYSKLQVYDTNGNLIFERNCTNSAATKTSAEQINYTAPEGLSIGKVVVWSDGYGALIDNFTTVLAPEAVTGQNLLDHNWETYFDDRVISYSVQDYAQSFANNTFKSGASLAGYHSTEGGFTISGAASQTAAGSVWVNAMLGSMFVDSAKTAVVTFDTARSSIEVNVTGIEATAGNSGVLKVYDTSGGLLDTVTMTNTIGTYDIQSFNYEANGNVIGRIEITGDQSGMYVTSISSEVSQASVSNGVISMSIDPTAYFLQDTAHIFGSAGVDTLKLTGANQILDLRSLTGDSGAAKISSIEKFDITGTGNNTLKLSLNDVLHLGETDMFQKDGKVQVLVDGDAGDKVELYGLHDHGAAVGTWQSAGTTSIGGATYQVYSYSTLDAEVLIKQAVTSTVV